jgi:GMP synthase (glutamine-hydrolysing)
MIYIVDFGSQTAHLIARRIKELGSGAKIILPETALEIIKQEKPNGIILSGGPSSVYEKGAPTIDKEIFDLNIPVFGICYGWQLMARLLGGTVQKTTKEYGPEKITVKRPLGILGKLPKKQFTAYVSHGDSVTVLPKDFVQTALTNNVEFTAVQNIKKHLYGVQFHPEIEHTEYGNLMFNHFIGICKVKKQKHVLDTQKMIQKIKDTVGDCYVVGAVSGGVDSTVAGTLVARAIGRRFIPVFVDNGLMRDDAKDSVRKAFEPLGVKPIVVKVEKEMLKLLKGITDGEEKRKIIGKFYIDVFEKELKKRVSHKGKEVFLLQGTIFSDVIESKGTKHSSHIKSHHNVGGLPKDMVFKLLEPLRDLYKDEVRELGRKIGLKEFFVMKQVFPGPGYAVRIRGEVTPERLSQAKHADRILLDELEKTGWLKKVYMSFPVMTGAYSTAVKGDGRFFGEVIALRIIQSSDVMSAQWARLECDLLQKISSRIVNEVLNISRVVFDITTKPPSTMEWE